MKTKHLLALLAMCAAAALAGCASTDRQMSWSSLDEKNVERDEALSPTGLSQPVILEEGVFRKLDPDTNGTVTFDEWRRFDTNTVAKGNFGTPGEDGAGQINMTEFATQTLKHSKLYPLFGEGEQINKNHSFWVQQELQPQGLRLFSIRF